jgi:phosphoribosylformylglycinamidine synthase
VLRLPAVADKSFLITIGDRTVGGTDQPRPAGRSLAGTGQRRGVTLADYRHHAGEAMAIGERTPVALLDAPAAARLAVTEAITNMLAADVARWRRAAVGQLDGRCGEPGEDAALYAAVRAVGEQLCPALGIAIPVGKDSLSMKTAGRSRVRPLGVAPVSLIVSAFAPVATCGAR